VRAGFAETPGAPQMRAFQGKAAQEGDVIATIELAGAIPVVAPKTEAFGPTLRAPEPDQRLYAVLALMQGGRRPGPMGKYTRAMVPCVAVLVVGLPLVNRARRVLLD